MSNSNLKDDEFIFVSSKKSRKKTKINFTADFSQQLDESLEINKETSLRRIETAKEEISTSDLFCSLLASLREGLQALENPEIKEIICLGIGHIGELIVPRYQLALLLCFRDKLDIKVFVQDPVLWKIEDEILNDLNCEVLKNNLEGKYKVETCAKIFYLPHCPKQLTNNLLWSNWGLNLKNCIIISNSFCTLTENLTKRQLIHDANYISDILPHTLELAVINSFKYFDVFNDTAIHIFPLNKISLLSTDFWENREEPSYNDNIEFIKNITKIT